MEIVNPTWHDVMKFDLPDNPIIFDIGGYKGDFTAMCLEMYPNAKMFVFEPTEEYYRIVFERFKIDGLINRDATIIRFGISDLHGQKYMYGAGDSKSIIESDGVRTVNEFTTLENVCSCYAVKSIDLIKLNVEGAEYEILEKILSDGTALVYKNILVQFHKNVPDYEKRRKNIVNKLFETHDKILNYDFIFEGCKLKTN